MNKFKRATLLLFVSLSCLLAAGCSSEPEYRTVTRLDNICTESTSEKRANFTLTCIKNANPKSDEEPEDWIYKCEQMAVDTYCPKKQVSVNQTKRDNGWWKDTKIVEIGS